MDHPEYLARRERRVRERLQQARQQKVIEAPLLADCAAAGVPVDSVWDFTKAGSDYSALLPVFLKWLPLMRDAHAKQGIVRALTRRWARPAAAEPLIKEFRRVDADSGGYVGLGGRWGSLKWAIGNALDVVADDSVFEELVDIARERRHGRTREMVVLALGNMRNPTAVDVLLDLLNDEDVAGHAVGALGKLKASKAKPDLERFLHHEKDWIRQAAQRALAKIERAEQKMREKRSSSP
jgi:hypothetical protein